MIYLSDICNETNLKENHMQKKCVQGDVEMKSEINEDENINFIKEESQTNSSYDVKIEIEEVNVKQEPYEMFMEYNDEKHINENENISCITNKEHIANPRVCTNLKEEYVSEAEDSKDNDSNDEYLPSNVLSSATSEAGDSDLEATKTRLPVIVIPEEHIANPRVCPNLKEEYVSEAEDSKDNDSNVEYLPSNALSSATSEAGDSDLDATKTQLPVSCKIIDSKGTHSNITEYATGELCVKEEFVNISDGIDPLLPENASTDVDIKNILEKEETNNAEYFSTMKTTSRSTQEKANKCRRVADIKSKQSIPLSKDKRTDEKRHKCKVCYKTFSRKNSLIIHKRTHTGEKPYICEVCGKAFSEKNSLIRHKRIHTGEQPYACDVCEKAFSEKSTLIRHKLTHTGEKPYKCDVCEKAFSEKIALIRHKPTHTGEKPYACDFCGKAFSQKGDVLKHKRIHTGEKPYKCDICDKEFRRSDFLTRHKRIHTGE